MFVVLEHCRDLDYELITTLAIENNCFELVYKLAHQNENSKKILNSCELSITMLDFLIKLDFFIPVHVIESIIQRKLTDHVKLLLRNGLISERIFQTSTQLYTLLYNM
jgi:hypothetical protein